MVAVNLHQIVRCGVKPGNLKDLDWRERVFVSRKRLIINRELEGYFFRLHIQHLLWNSTTINYQIALQMPIRKADGWAGICSFHVLEFLIEPHGERQL
jgi:hypothetical protein